MGSYAGAPGCRINAHLGMRVREMRKRRGMSLRQLGDVLDVSPQQISRFESGQQRLSAEQLYKLACGFGTPVSWFFHGYEPSAAEQDWMRFAVREPRAQWSAQSDEDQEKALITAWRALRTSAQRSGTIALLEAFAFESGDESERTSASSVSRLKE